MDTGNLIFAVFVMGSLAYAATGWFFRGMIKPEARWRGFS